MKIEGANEENLKKLQTNLIQREKHEKYATATQTTETLSQLNISIDALPQRCQQLLQNASMLQTSLDIEILDPVNIAVRQSKAVAQQLQEEYELMELRHKNLELQMKIDRNEKFIEGLKRELQESKQSLQSQEPNPDNIQEHIRQTKQKLASYEEICEKAKSKFSKLQVPDAILPKSIEELANRLATLKAEEEGLKQRAEDITLARQARDTLHKLRRV